MNNNREIYNYLYNKYLSNIDQIIQKLKLHCNHKIKWYSHIICIANRNRIKKLEFRREVLSKKFKRVPDEFIDNFNSLRYILANKDVDGAIKRGRFEYPLEHFILRGFDEVLKGERVIGSAFPYFDAKEYQKQFITNMDDNKEIKTNPYIHYLKHGYIKHLNEDIRLEGRYPFRWNRQLQKNIESKFDEESYIEANPDVAKAIQKGQFSSGWDHFIRYGYKEVRRGDRTIHPKIPLINESDYILCYRDIHNALKKGKILSPYKHFLLNGVKEILDGSRSYPRVYAPIPRLTAEVKRKISKFKKKPLISIVMPVYNVEPKLLNAAIESLNMQWYHRWELCMADDASTNPKTVELLDEIQKSKNPKIKIVRLKKGKHISGASNEALKLAKGSYVALMDHDDELSPNALYEIVEVINNKDVDFIYSDEDKIEMHETYSEPHFKPNFAPDTFLSRNYISHLAVIKRSILKRVGGWSEGVGVEGAQDYDLYLKIFEHTDKIAHIPKILYHWRKVPGSTASEFNEKSYAKEAGRVALQRAMKRRRIEAEVLHAKYPGTYRVKYKIEGNPKVSIVMPFRDKPELLKMAIESILNKSSYKNFELIGISNNSSEREVFELMDYYSKLDNRIKFYELNIPFNYSRINNIAIRRYAKGEHLILLNNDIEIISSEWIEAMLEFSQRKDVGAVGAKLYYPDDTIQHAGVTIGVLTLAGHNFRHLHKDHPGYMGIESVIQNVSAVTGACLMVKRELYQKIGGLNDKDLKVAFNDIDFCLRLQEEGYLNVYTPYCEAYHHESVSRGSEDNPKKRRRFKQEVEYMLNRHKKILSTGDPYYNPNLTLEKEDFSFRWSILEEI